MFSRCQIHNNYWKMLHWNGSPICLSPSEEAWYGSPKAKYLASSSLCTWCVHIRPTHIQTMQYLDCAVFSLGYFSTKEFYVGGWQTTMRTSIYIFLNKQITNVPNHKHLLKVQVYLGEKSLILFQLYLIFPSNQHNIFSANW